MSTFSEKSSLQPAEVKFFPKSWLHPAEVKKKKRWWGVTIRMNSGVLRVARGGSGLKPLRLPCDSVGWFRRYQCSALLIYHSNLSMCGTFLQKSIHLPDNRGLLATPKEIYNLILNAVSLSVWWFQTATSIFCAKELYNPVFFLLSLHPLGTTLTVFFSFFFGFEDPT